MKCEFEYCDNEVVAIHTDARAKNKKFCSKKCCAAVRRREFKAMLVKYCGGKCQCCGYNKYDGSLDFHHVDDGDKEFGLTGAQHIAISTVIEELDKCIVVCANCHREIHGKLIACPAINMEYRDSVRDTVTKKKQENNSGYKTSTKQPRTILNANCITVDCIGLVYDKGGYCRKCAGRKAAKEVGNWPTNDELEILAWKIPTRDIGKQVGVSDKAVEKRMKRLGITKPPRGYWARLAKEIMSKQNE